MSDDTIERTEEEIAANVAKLRAEARKAEAEAAVADLEASKTRIELAKKEHEAAEWRAKDVHHRVYDFSESVTATSVSKCVAQLLTWSRLDAETGSGPQPMEIIFAVSPGGSIFDGFYLFDQIRELANKGHHITTGTYGMAASMSGVLLQAGDTRWCSMSSWVMIHSASFGVSGQTHDVKDQLKLVERLEDRLFDIYVKRSDGKLTRRKIKANSSRRDWWLSAGEALKLGVVDELRGGLEDEVA